MKKILLLLIPVVWTFLACEQPGDESTPAVPVTSVEFTASTLTLDVGGTSALEYTVLPADAADKSVVFTSSNEAVAAVSSEGHVSAIAPGQAVITVTTNDGAKTAEITVTVSAVAVTGITFVSLQTEVSETKTVTLVPVITPSNATDKTVNYTSSNPAVAAVSAEGVVEGLLAGEAVITATTVDGGHSESVTVTVKAHVPVTSISFSDGVTVWNGNIQETVAKSLVVSPANATIKSFTVVPGNDKFLSYSVNGDSVTLNAINNGSQTVEFISDDNPEIKAVLTVNIDYITNQSYVYYDALIAPDQLLLEFKSPVDETAMRNTDNYSVFRKADNSPITILSAAPVSFTGPVNGVILTLSETLNTWDEIRYEIESNNILNSFAYPLLNNGNNGVYEKEMFMLPGPAVIDQSKVTVSGSGIQLAAGAVNIPETLQAPFVGVEYTVLAVLHGSFPEGDTVRGAATVAGEGSAQLAVAPGTYDLYISAEFSVASDPDSEQSQFHYNHNSPLTVTVQ